jgi:hypothetical protein
VLAALRKKLGRSTRSGSLGGTAGPSRPPTSADGPNHWVLINNLLRELQSSREGIRAGYAWPILHTAAIAARTGRERISVLEFGVAGGNGLIAMEAAAMAAESELGVGIDIYGFDTGQGLPRPRDFRDAPFVSEEGSFPMDQDRLRARLDRAELILGDVASTVAPFLESDPSPIGFISFDLDYYTSTRDALAVLRADPRDLMPRILCYFDDVHGYPWGDFNGARLAIDEFNSDEAHRKIARLHGLKYTLPRSEFEQRWPDAMYVAHLFDHPAYADPEGTELVTRLDLIEPNGVT